MGSFSDFVRESNRIEGILRSPSKAEIDAHHDLLKLREVTVPDMVEFVGVIAPGKPIRQSMGMDVRVCDHIAPEGGAHILGALDNILSAARDGEPAYFVHQRYEDLHPFMDGNGRSGRALWLWSMQESGRLESALRLGFLHTWYYQSLSYSTMRR